MHGALRRQRLTATAAARGHRYGTGYIGAYGAALALLHRRRTGKGPARLHRARAHRDAAADVVHGRLRRREADEPRGYDAIGDGPLHRFYGQDDGWFFLGAHRSAIRCIGIRRRLARDSRATLEDDLASALFERFRTAPVAAWVERLTTAGIAVHRYVHDIREVMDDQWSREHGLSISRDHDGVGAMTHTGPAPRLSRTPVRPGRSTPKIGAADPAELLAELGLADRAGSFSQRLSWSAIAVDNG